MEDIVDEELKWMEWIDERLQGVTHGRHEVMEELEHGMGTPCIIES